jgi:hypothetical protein
VVAYTDPAREWFDKTSKPGDFELVKQHLTTY